MCFVFTAQAQYDLTPTKSEKMQKWGYVSKKTGETMIDFQYDKAEYFHENLGKVKVGKNWGVIDVEGKIVLPINFSEIEFYYSKYILAKNDNGWGIYFKDGSKNEKVQGFEYLMQNSYTNDSLFLFDKKKKMGLVNIKGEVLIPAEYEYLYPCSGLDSVYVTLHKGQFGLFKLGKGMIIPVEYELNKDDLSGIGSDGHVAFFGEKKQLILNNGKKWGVLDMNGKEIIPFEYDEIELYDDQKEWGEFSVARFTKGRVTSFVGTDLQSIYDEPIEKILGYYDGYSNYLIIKLADDDRMIFYDGDTRKIVQEIDYTKHDRMKAYYTGNLNEGKSGLMTHKGEVLIPYQYDYVAACDYKEGGLRKKHFLVSNDKLYGVFKLGEGVVIPIQYKSIGYMAAYNSEYLSVTNETGKCALADMEGKLMTDFKYKAIWLDSKTRTIIASLDNKERVKLDNMGKEMEE